MKNLVLGAIAKKSSSIPWIVDHTHVLVRHGSIAYGTNTSSSDEDFKGVAIPPKEYYFGNLYNFEQSVTSEPYDTVIFEIKKFFKLATDANPNIIEVLHTDPQDHIFISPIGQKIIDNKDLFLSKKVKHTFLGYAVSQLNRMKLHKSYIDKKDIRLPTRQEFGLSEYPEIPKEQRLAAEAEIQKYLDKLSFDFMDHLEESTKNEIKYNITKTLAELKISSDEKWNAAARTIGMNDNFIEIMQKERAFNAKVKAFNDYQTWVKTRNPKRFADEEKYGMDLKHCYHLVRLCRMAEEILTTGKVLVKRPDAEELLAIRNGAWTYDQVLQFAKDQEEKMHEVYLSSTLSREPKRQKIDKLLISLIEESLSC